jgi:hypothetical protein
VRTSQPRQRALTRPYGFQVGHRTVAGDVTPGGGLLVGISIILDQVAQFAPHAHFNLGGQRRSLGSDIVGVDWTNVSEINELDGTYRAWR